MAVTSASSSNTATRARSLRRQSLLSHAAVFLWGCCCTTFVLNVFHGSVMHNDATLSVEDFADKHVHSLKSAASAAAGGAVASKKKTAQHVNSDNFQSIAGLKCDKYGGPSEEASQEMVYWRDITSDNAYESPFHTHETIRYLTFEPDGGGWNNIRMAMETVLALAMATGRTLVLPPSQQMYLLGENTFSFADFFPLHEIAKEHPGLDIITMQVFLERTNGKWVDKVTGRPSTPPGSRTNWDADTVAVKKDLNPWLQSVAESPDWNPAKCLAAFPASSQPEDVVLLQETFDHIVHEVNPVLEDFVNHPTPVNASVLDRMTEFIANRKQICLYTNELQQEPLLHYHGKKTLGGRLLVHFYAFLFFQDWKEDLWTKRFVRDHVRYVDEIQCAAARVVEAVRQHARDKGTSADGIFDSFHIRRGDFQYKKTRLPSDEIYENSKDVIPEGTTVFVATDERSMKFFEPMAEHWDLLYLKDFQHLIDGIDKNFYGMIDQLIASRGRTFVGCWFSSFTGYINRLRGYHSDLDHLEGYEMGIIDSYYYALEEHKTRMRDYWPIKQAFYTREYPTSWRFLDHGVFDETK